MVYEKRDITVSGRLLRSKWQQLATDLDDLGLSTTVNEVEELTGAIDGPVRVIGRDEYLDAVGNKGGSGNRSWRALAYVALKQADGIILPEEDPLTALRFQVNPAEDIYAPRNGVQFLDQFDGLESPSFQLFASEVHEIVQSEGTAGLPQSILGRGVGIETIKTWVEIANRDDIGHILE